MFKHLTLSSLLVAFTLILAAPTQAATSEASQFVNTLASDTIAVLSNDKISDGERQEAFRTLLTQGFDLPLIARFVVGRYWRSASEAEKAEFMATFEDYLVVSYAARLGNYSGQVLRVVNDRDVDGNDVMVASEIQQGTAPAIKVDWRLRRTENTWRIIDIAVEGVSMAVAQRSEFGAVIRAKGGKLPALTQVLRAKADTMIKREVASK